MPLLEGLVPERLDDALVRGPVVEAARGAVLLRLPRVGRFLVRVGRQTVVERAEGATGADVRCFADGPVAAAAALLRGALPLRASCVSIDGRAVAIAGGAVAGKSAVAAALALRGHPLLADAVTVVEPDGAGTVEPVAPRVVLWPDAIDELGLGPADGEPVRPALPTRAFELSPANRPAPLAALVVLSRDPRLAKPVAAPLSGWAKTAALMGATWHNRLVEPLGLAATTFGRLAETATQLDAVSVVRPRDGCAIESLATLVEEQLA
jgi:hypothetical protein